MTSNLASDEIANHALKLRKEASKAVEKYRHLEQGENYNQSLCLQIHLYQTEPEDYIEISREFKTQVVEPILKVRLT